MPKDLRERIQAVTTAPSWLTLCLDVPAARSQTGRVFWQAATGYELSPARGERAEFATLVPPTADAHLQIQSTLAGDFRVNLDLHVGDLAAAVKRAIAVGAEVVAEPGHAILRSPAGFVFCLVPSHEEKTPAVPGDWGTHRSRPDQLTIDVAHDAWDREKTFWSELTDWAVTRSSRQEYVRLQTPASMPVRILLQRLDAGTTSGHLDIATNDRFAESKRLGLLGATQILDGPAWTVMKGPDSSIFCVTDRDPDTGLLP